MNFSSYCVVALTGGFGGRQRNGEKVSFSGEDVFINVNGKLAFLRKQQVEVFKHLSQKEGIHPGQTETGSDFSSRGKERP